MMKIFDFLKRIFTHNELTQEEEQELIQKIYAKIQESQVVVNEH